VRGLSGLDEMLEDLRQLPEAHQDHHGLHASERRPIDRLADARASWPVTTVNEEFRPRSVNGIPAYAGTAIAELTPGTIS